MAKVNVKLTVNGKKFVLDVEANELLVDVLRERLGLTGTKAGCREGECGACSVILNGKLVNSCLVPILKADGGKVVTIEGLEQNGQLHIVQQKFVENGAIQCGFCTPAMVLAGKLLLDTNPKPTKDQIKEAISGILCRCTGYQKIIKAIDAASKPENRGAL